MVCLRMYSSVISSRETCFEKSEVLNGFINDVSKSRNRDFCSRESGEGGGHMMFLSKGSPLE